MIAVEYGHNLCFCSKGAPEQILKFYQLSIIYIYTSFFLLQYCMYQSSSIYYFRNKLPFSLLYRWKMEAVHFSVHCISCMGLRPFLGNARETLALILYCSNTNLMQMSWECATCSKGGDYFYFSCVFYWYIHIIHSSLVNLVIAWFFLDKLQVCLLKGRH